MLGVSWERERKRREAWTQNRAVFVGRGVAAVATRVLEVAAPNTALAQSMGLRSGGWVPKPSGDFEKPSSYQSFFLC